MKELDMQSRLRRLHERHKDGDIGRRQFLGLLGCAAATVGVSSSVLVAAMRDAFERSAEDRTKIAFFNESVFTCNMLEAALAQLDAGECPEDVPSDARCLCGNQRYPDEWSGGPARCDSYDPVADRYGGGRRLRAGH